MGDQEYEFLVEVGPGRDAVGQTPSTSPIYRCRLSKDGFETEFNGAKTLLEVSDAVFKSERNQPCLGTRGVKADGSPGPYKWSTYRDVALFVDAMDQSLRRLGCKKGTKIGIYGTNCPEWFVAMQTCHKFAGIYVPVYDTLAPHAVEYILGHSEAEFIFVSDQKLKDLIKALKNMDVSERKIKGACYWGKGLSEEEASAYTKDLEALGIRVWAWENFDREGILIVNKEYPAEVPTAEDPCMIMYTSGTTGDPKGVVMTHRALITLINSSIAFANDTGVMKVTGQVYMSYLPLAHVYGQVMEYLTFAMGGKIGYWRGNIRELTTDIVELKPTSMTGVPRVWERIYETVMREVSKNFISRILYHFAFNWKLSYIQSGYPSSKASPFFDWLIFNKIKARLGGHITWVSNGAAPLAPHLENFIRVSLGVAGFQGYGLTETGGITFVAYPDRHDMFGTVGPVQPCGEFRLQSVPELGYDANGDVRQGEVCVRGPCLFSAYHKNAAEYAKAVDKEGFFHTGDVAELHESGAIKIIDRLKNIFKLSQGEYVAVEKIESILKAAPTVEQIWVYGNSMRRSLVAIVHPNKRVLESLGISGDMSEICGLETAKKVVKDELAAAGAEGSLKGFEKVRDVWLTSEPFTVENELMTPSFKLKRHMILKKYQEEVDEMYEKLEGAI